MSQPQDNNPPAGAETHITNTALNQGVQGTVIGQVTITNTSVQPPQAPATADPLALTPPQRAKLLALQTDDLLRKLARTPLIVNVLLLAYAGREVPTVRASTPEELRAALCDRLLLERDGAIYRFRHILLRDFCADLSDGQIADLAREADS